jgi:hypothetical protein
MSVYIPHNWVHSTNVAVKSFIFEPLWKLKSRRKLQRLSYLKRSLCWRTCDLIWTQMKVLRLQTLSTQIAAYLSMWLSCWIYGIWNFWDVLSHRHQIQFRGDLRALIHVPQHFEAEHQSLNFRSLINISEAKNHASRGHQVLPCPGCARLFETRKKVESQFDKFLDRQ